MKFVSLMVFSGLMAASSVFAADGPSTGGGGASVVCRGSDHKIKSAELLDLYEARVRYGLQTPKSNESVQIQFNRAFGRLVGFNWFLGSDTEEALRKVISKIEYLPPGVAMAPGVDLGDSYAALIPDGCELSYVGYYESDGTLRVSKTIFDKLSQTDRAALLMHEALYKVARDLGKLNKSLSSRVVTGFLFSNAKDLTPMKPFSDSMRWVGYSGISRNVINQSVVMNESLSKIVIEGDKGVSADVGSVIYEALCLDSNFETFDLARDSRQLSNEAKEFSIPANCRYVHVRVSTGWKGTVGTGSLPVVIKLNGKKYFETSVLPYSPSPNSLAGDVRLVLSVYPSRTIQLPAMPF